MIGSDSAKKKFLDEYCNKQCMYKFKSLKYLLASDLEFLRNYIIYTSSAKKDS